MRGRITNTVYARISMLKHNANTKPGGGPHTLICSGSCRKEIAEGDEISGPSRNRDNSPLWTNPGDPNYYHKLTYWHQDCNRPLGFRTGLAPQTVIVGSNGAGNEWQRTPPVQREDERIANENATPPTNAAELVTTIVSAVESNLLPQIEQGFDELNRRIDKHIEATVSHNVHGTSHLSEAIADNYNDLQARLATQADRIKQLEANQPTIIQFNNNDNTHTQINIGTPHKDFIDLLDAMRALPHEMRNVWLVGPAGSGKTTAARKVSEVLNLDFYFTGAISQPFELLGFIDAGGRYNTTPFREAWEKGGVMLWDEFDGSEAQAALTINGPTANGHATFPDNPIAIPRHPNCYLIVAANTYGLGGDAKYVGRTKMDAATLDRFVPIEWGYDNDLELRIANDPTPSQSWTIAIQQARANAASHGADMLITPRATMFGAAFLRAGYSREKVVRLTVGKYRKHNLWSTIGKPIEDWALQTNPR